MQFFYLGQKYCEFDTFWESKCLGSHKRWLTVKERLLVMQIPFEEMEF